MSLCHYTRAPAASCAMAHRCRYARERACDVRDSKSASNYVSCMFVQTELQLEGIEEALTADEDGRSVKSAAATDDVHLHLSAAASISQRGSPLLRLPAL